MSETDTIEAGAQPAPAADTVTDLATTSPNAVALLGESISVQQRALLPVPLAQLREVADFMASSGPMVPPHFQNQPDLCMAIAYQAARWGQDPIAVAQKAYVSKDKANRERISYEAQLIVSIINSRAPLQKPLSVEYEGEGGDRYCTVIGWLRGDSEPRTVTSPRKKNIRPQNSPLWFSDPDQQLWYYTARAWARRWSPETLLGIYAPEELGIIDATATEVTTKRAMDFYAPAEPVDAVFEAVPSGGKDYEPPKGQKTEGHPFAPENDAPRQKRREPSGGATHANADGGKAKADLGENPWPDVEDIMEWPAMFREALAKASTRSEVDRLVAQAKAFGLLPRLARASKADVDTLAGDAQGRWEELPEEEA